MKFEIKIFVLFHENLFGYLYRNLKKYRKNLVFVGSKRWSFRLRLPIKHCDVIYVNELGNFNANLEKRGYKETSTIYHLYINKLYQGLDYIGFAQYDMGVGDYCFDTVKQKLVNNPGKNYIFYMEKVPMIHSDGLVYNFFHPATELLINSYNRHFGTNYTIDGLIHNPVTANNLILYSTFIIPVKIFEKMMGWIVALLPEIDFLADKPYPIANLTERAFGLALALELLNTDTELAPAPIQHLQDVQFIRLVKIGVIEMLVKNFVKKKASLNQIKTLRKLYYFLLKVKSFVAIKK